MVLLNNPKCINTCKISESSVYIPLAPPQSSRVINSLAISCLNKIMCLKGILTSIILLIYSDGNGGNVGMYRIPPNG